LVVGLPVFTVVLVGHRDRLSLGTVLLVYLLAVVVVAVVGGIVPAVIAALVSVLLANFFFTMPYHSLVVAEQENIVALIVFVVVAVMVSVTVEVAAGRRAAVARSRVEADMLSRFAAEPVSEASLAAILDQVRVVFGMTSVALLEGRDGRDEVVGAVGPPLRGRPVISVVAGDGLRLVAGGPELFAEDRRLVSRLAAAAARAWEAQRLAGEAAQLADVDRLRAALLAAVGHDLRTPLAGLKAAVTSLRQRDVTWTVSEREEFLATIDESADRLDELIANLLAMSRLQAGALSLALQPVALDEIVAHALLGVSDADVQVDVPDDLPFVQADPGLLERIVANLVANARKFSPSSMPAQVEASTSVERVQLRVVDHGPGVPETDWDRMFAPFQRLGDRSAHSGVGLGLSIARGFAEAMGGTLTPSTTDGGGLTMTLDLPRAS
jgi:K+-sensing histidine kinase KdpD